MALDHGPAGPIGRRPEAAYPDLVQGDADLVQGDDGRLREAG